MEFTIRRNSELSISNLKNGVMSNYFFYRGVSLEEEPKEPRSAALLPILNVTLE